MQRRLKKSEDETLGEIRKLHDWQSTGSEEDDFVMFANWSSVSLTFPFPYPELEYLFFTDRNPQTIPQHQPRLGSVGSCFANGCSRASASALRSDPDTPNVAHRPIINRGTIAIWDARK